MSHVDSPSTNTHVSLCAGYGGIDLGLKRSVPDLRTVAFCEIEAFACANLVAKMEAGLLDPSPIWTDLKTFPWGAFRDRVDILSGGYPCQPFSSAGKRLGKDDHRHLWPWIADGISIMRPRICFFENVEGHITMGLSSVISDLEEMGYQVAWGIFSAAEIGAPHQRKRVFILAHRHGHGLERYVPESEAKQSRHGSQDGVSGADDQLADNLSKRVKELSGKIADQQEQHSTRNDGRNSLWPSRPGESQREWEPPRVVDSQSGRISGRQKSQREAELTRNGEVVANCNGELRGSSTEGREHDSEAGSTSEGDCQRQIESTLGGNSDGSSDRVDDAELFITSDNRTDELRLLGNGVVPATAERAFRVLWEEITK